MGRPCSLGSQLRGPAVGTIGKLVHRVISPVPWVRSHFSGVLVPCGLACWVWQGRSCLGGVPAEASGLGRVGGRGMLVWGMCC